MAQPESEGTGADVRWRTNLGKVAVFLLLFAAVDYLVAIALLGGVRRMYGLGGDADVLMVGHSHLMLAVDKRLVEERSGLQVAKYTREGVNVADRQVMVRHYFDTCKAEPRVVVLGIDPWLFTGEGLSQNSYRLFLPFMDGPAIEQYVRASASSRYEYLRARWVRTSRYTPALANAALRGWLGNWSNLKVGVVDSVRVRSQIASGGFRHIGFSRELIDQFAATLDFLAQRPGRVVLLNTPVWQPLVGAQGQDNGRAIGLIDSLAREHCPGAVLIDLAPEYGARTELLFDPIHMNPAGQREVTLRLVGMLDSLRVRASGTQGTQNGSR